MKLFNPITPFLAASVALLTASVSHADIENDHSLDDAFAAEIASLIAPPPPGDQMMVATPVAPEINGAAPGDPVIGANPQTMGAWSGIIPWTPHVPVTGALLPDGRLLTFASNQRNAFPSGPEFTYAAVWNPETGAFTEVNRDGHDMFCGGVAMLPDGRLLVNGGRTCNRWSSIFDWRTTTWSAIQNMNDGRWYNTSVAMVSGEVFTATGTNGERTTEMWNSATGWRRFTGIDWQTILNEAGFDQRWHPFLFLAPDGRIFHAGPTDRMNWVNTSGNGSLTYANVTVPGTQFPKEGAWVMYNEGRVLVSGGFTAPSNGTASQAAYTVDLRGASPVVANTGSMANARTFANAVMLPNGEVMVVGGNTSTAKFSDSGSVFPAEIWDPSTGTWRTVASISVGRNYHSLAFLLPDGRVWSGGGGLAGNSSVDHPDAQVFTPPQLLNSDGTAKVRPVITNTPDRIGPGVQFTVKASPGVTRFTLIRLNSLTHSVSSDLRFLELPSVQTAPGTYELTSRTNLNVMTPGYWMLFALDSAGVHSKSKIIQVTADANPTVTNPGPQTSERGSSVALQIFADTAGTQSLTYSATGLPPGLSIHPTSGTISGTPTTAGLFNTTVTVTDGINPPTNIAFTWTIVESITIGTLSGPPRQVNTSITFAAPATNAASPQYSWDFGDGSAATAFSAATTTTKTYTTPGRYLVTLTVRDSAGRIASTSFFQAIYSALTTQSPRASSPILFEPRAGANARVWTVNPDTASVAVIDAITRTKLAEPATGEGPRTLALAPDGRVWVTCVDAAQISILSPSTLSSVATVNLPRGSRPFGIAFAPDGSAAWVACEGSGALLKLNPTTGATIATAALGQNVRHVAVSADSTRVLVSRFVTPPVPGEDTASPQTTVGTTKFGGEVVVVNASNATINRTTILEHSERVDTATSARGIPNYLGAAAISPDGLSAWIPSKQDNIKLGVLRKGTGLTHDQTIRAIASRIDLSTLAETTSARLDFDNAGMPSAAVFDPTGSYLYVALEASREIAVCDARRGQIIQRFFAGRAPQGLTLSPDGATLFVQNFMSRTVTVHDVSRIQNGGDQPVGTAATVATVANERLSPQVLLGKQHFYDAFDPRLALQSYISCASCHNDGGQDGRTWDLTGFGEGLRNTITLRGHGGMAQGPLHWSANFDEVQDFEGQIRNLSGGTGFLSDSDFAATSAPLGAPKAGRSADLDALAAYVASLQATPTSPARNSDGTLTADAVLGEQIFRAQNCAACHSGSQFTNSGTAMHDIGTLRPSSGARLGGTLSGLDAPSLRGAWATAPYLHDGRAATIADAIAAHNGVTLNSTDLARLAAYVSQIDAEPATAPAPDVQPPTFTTLLSDDFNDNARDAAKWTIDALFAQIDSGAAAFDSSIVVAERNQRLEIVPRTNVAGDHYAGFVSAGLIDFTSATASVRVIQTANGDADTYLAVAKDSANFLLLVVESGALHVDHVVGRNRSFSNHTFSPSQQYWRIRNTTGTTIAFETSADGSAWQTLRTVNAGFPLTSVRAEIGAGTWKTESAPGMAVFDNFAVTRPAPASNQPPVARPGGPYNATAGVALALNASTSSDPDGTIASYAWNFGDGTTGTGATPSKTYATAGSFTISLTVTDNAGSTNTATTTASVVASNQPPVARAGGPYTGTAGVALALNGSTSSDPDGTIASYAWNFGDGTTGTGATPSKTYATAGTFTVTLTVTDNNGATHSAATTATIALPPNQPPVARPGGPYTGTRGVALALNGSTSSDPDGTIASYAWNFGDGTTGTGATPSKTYATAGSFTVTLTVTDNRGGTHSATTTATINPPGNIAPVARPGGPYASAFGQPVVFDGSTSTDSDGSISSYQWFLGDTMKLTNVQTDDFNDNARDTAKWSVGAIFGTVFAGAAGYDPGITVAERNARLEIALRPNLAGDRYAGFVTATAQDFTGGSTSVEVVQAAGGASDTLLCVSKDSQNSALIVAEAGGLYFIQKVGGQFAVSGTTYSPTQHRHWRIRHAGSLLMFDVSSNGTSWLTLHSEPARFAVTSTRIECSAGTWQPESAPGTAIFDNFRFARATAGTETTLTGASPTFTYPVPGTYTARLRVTDNSGAANEATTTVTVSPQAPGPGSVYLGGGSFNETLAARIAVRSGPATSPSSPGAARGKWIAISDATYPSRLDLTVASRGVYSAKLITPDGTHAFTGKLSADGTAAATIKRRSTPLRVQLSFDATAGLLRGAIHGDSLIVELSGHATAERPDLAGRTTVALNSADSAGSGIVAVHPGCSVRLTAQLDGSKFVSNAPISRQGFAPVYATVRSQTWIGWLNLNGAPQGEIAWQRTGEEAAQVTVSSAP